MVNPRQANNAYARQNADCPHLTFVLDPVYLGRTKQVKQQIVETLSVIGLFIKSR